MPKRTFIIILAVCVAIMPFLGFPSSWEDSFYAGAGTLIFVLSVDWSFLRKKKVRGGRGRKAQQTDGDVYVESVPMKASGAGMGEEN